MRRLAGQRGQASVELLAMAPVVVSLGLGAAQLLAAGAAHQVAAGAAQAGAMAIIQGGDPRAAARAAAPDWARERLVIDRSGPRVRVRLAPRAVVPGLSSLLSADELADAGPGS